MSDNTYILNLQKKLIKVCLKKHIPFTSFRLPLENEIISLVQHSSLPEKINTFDNLYDKKGFIVSPFTETNNNEVYFLNPDLVLDTENIEDKLIRNLENNYNFSALQKKENTLLTTSYDDFTASVNHAISEIAEKKFRKVVLSRVRVEELPEKFKAEDFFLKLCRRYPHAFVYIMQLPEVGCWIGATPEPLLTIENGTVQTVSLAGTQLAQHRKVENHSWNKKEIEEQEIVTNFVEEKLNALGIYTLIKKGPENYKAANLIHLRTIFEFTEKDLRNRHGEFLKALHPTPSVGGLPQKEACNYILNSEKHNRSFYSGFLGTVNINKKSAIFVNLRCLQIFPKNYVLYSGAGITLASVAQKEWEETDNKMLTMMNAMKNFE